jgi:hypothetical protein
MDKRKERVLGLINCEIATANVSKPSILTINYLQKRYRCWLTDTEITTTAHINSVIYRGSQHNMCRLHLAYAANVCSFCSQRGIQAFFLKECIELESGDDPSWDQHGALIVPPNDAPITIKQVTQNAFCMYGDPDSVQGQRQIIENPPELWGPIAGEYVGTDIGLARQDWPWEPLTPCIRCDYNAAGNDEGDTFFQDIWTHHIAPHIAAVRQALSDGTSLADLNIGDYRNQAFLEFWADETKYDPASDGTFYNYLYQPFDMEALHEALPLVRNVHPGTRRVTYNRPRGPLTMEDHMIVQERPARRAAPSRMCFRPNTDTQNGRNIFVTTLNTSGRANPLEWNSSTVGTDHGYVGELGEGDQVIEERPLDEEDEDERVYEGEYVHEYEDEGVEIDGEVWEVLNNNRHFYGGFHSLDD